MLAKRAVTAGSAFLRRGSKARRVVGVGRAKAALPKVRERPLQAHTGVSTVDTQQLKLARALRERDKPLEHG